MIHETHWTGLSGLSWEREMDLQLFRHEIMRCWVGTPNQHCQTNACTAGCELVLHNESFLGATVSDSWRPVTAAFLAQNGLASTAPRCFPTEPVFGTRATTVCCGLERSARARLRMRHIGALLGRTAADQASSYSGALHDFDWGGTKFLVSPSALS